MGALLQILCSRSTDYSVEFSALTTCASFPATVPPDSSIAAAFAARVSLLLAEHGQSPTSATKDGKLGLTQQQLSDLVKGRHVPGGRVIVAIARHYSVSADWLLGLSPERRPLVGQPAGMIDDEIYRRWLSGEKLSGKRLAVPFPPHARLVDRAELDRILAEVDAKPTQKGLSWGRLRGRTKRAPE